MAASKTAPKVAKERTALRFKCFVCGENTFGYNRLGKRFLHVGPPRNCDRTEAEGGVLTTRQKGQIVTVTEAQAKAEAGITNAKIRQGRASTNGKAPAKKAAAKKPAAKKVATKKATVKKAPAKTAA